MNDDLFTEEYNGYTIRIYHDYDAESPEAWGNTEVFLVADHRDFCVEPPNGSTFDGVIDDYTKTHHMFPLEAYIHSGVRLYISGECAVDRQWDVSQLGAVFVAKSEARTRKAAEKLARGLIETWNTYLEGSVYGFVVERDGEHIGSCWGFYEPGHDIEKYYVLSEARSVADYDARERLEKHVAQRKAQIRAHAPLQSRSALA